MSGVKKRCPNYTGVTCVNGSCPIANRDTYIEYGVPVTWSCDECIYYEGCDDCYFCGENGECEIDERLAELKSNKNDEVNK